jgi:hypothetical protein
MYYFKVTKTWSVQAMSENDALRIIANNPDHYLESETVSRTVYKKKPPQKTSWGTAVKDQLLGNNSRKR